MAVQLVAAIHVFHGLSTDSKPVSGVRKGSTFYEKDTGLAFRLDGGNQWALDKGMALSAGEYSSGVSALQSLLEEILLELKAANEADGIEVS